MSDRKHKAPRAGRSILRGIANRDEVNAIIGDFEEEYNEIRHERGGFWASCRYWMLILVSLPSFIKALTYWSFAMFSNYVKTALRNINRYKGYTAINIAGLSIGIACCILIMLWVMDELSYDRHHADADRIYRVVLDIQEKADNRVFAMISPTAAPAIKERFPQVEEAVRIYKAFSARLVSYQDRRFYEENFMWADPEIFRIFNISFVSGDPETALERPGAIVITQHMASKYFEDENPIGKTINVNGYDYEVTGVIHNAVQNSHFSYGLIASMRLLENERMMENWHSTMFYTYVKLSPGADPAEFGRQVKNLADHYVGDRLRRWGSTYVYFIQPVSDIHLYSHLHNEFEPSGNPAYVYIFSVIGVLILLLAGVNFINLSTSRSVTRAKEVGMRKVVGAMRSQIIGQMISESVILCLLSLAAGLIMVAVVLPLFNDLSAKTFTLDFLVRPLVIFGIIGITVLLGIIASVYPAFYLAAYRPVQVLKGMFGSGRKGAGLRKVLVVAQFAIVIVLIIGTITAFRQVRYMKSRNLGFDKEQVLVIPVRGGISIADNHEMFKKRFLEHPSITGAAVSSSVPGKAMSNYAVKLVGEDEEMSQSMYHLYYDADFIPMYGLEIVAGRAFDKQITTDIEDKFILNETAVKAFGWSSPEEALGKKMNTGNGGRTGEIIGVVKDFHYRGLQSPVEALAMEYLPRYLRVINLKVLAAGLNETIEYIRRTWTDMYPNNPFEYSFLDEQFDLQYRSDERVGMLVNAFTIIAFIIACLGLYGLASFTTGRRTKEIGIRKVLGASIMRNVWMLSSEFTRLVLIANVIAWPVSYYIMNNWLQNFAYRITPGWFTFVIAAVFSILIAMFATVYQSLRASSVNPVTALRYE